MPLTNEDLERLSPHELLRLGADLFNAGQHFEAHEAWEAVWLDAPRELRWFYQGLIQVAAAFVHLKRDEYPGTVKLIDEGTAKLDKYDEDFLGVELSRFVTEARVVQETVIALGERRLREFDSASLPAVHFVPQGEWRSRDGVRWLEYGQAGKQADRQWQEEDRDVIVLIHSPAYVPSMWEPVAWRLSEAGYRIIAPELPGHGESRLESVDVEAEVERLRAWLQDEAPEPVAVVGVPSSAGIVARIAAGTGAIEVRLASRDHVVAGDGGLTPARHRTWPGRAEMFEGLRRRGQFARWRLDVLWRYVEDGTRILSSANDTTEAELVCLDETEQAWLDLGRPLGGMVEVTASPWEAPDVAAQDVIEAIANP